MLYTFAVLLSCQLAGEAFVRALSLAVPGPVVGMVLLAALMLLKAPLPSELGDTVDTLLKHLSLLFVPAGVGVVQHFDRLRGEGFQLLAVVVLSTAITLVVTAVVFTAVAHLMGPGADDDEHGTVP
ncbi:MAG: CidA/LrgA family protein [Xanthobacteraceae bacterium]